MKTGSQARPESLPEFKATMDEVKNLVATEAPWVQASDAPMVEVFAAELCLYRRVAVAQAAQPPRVLLKARGKSQAFQVRRLKELNSLAAQLGLTVGGRFRLGLTAAKTQAIRVQPVRSEERAIEVAGILAQARALPSLDPEQPLEPVAEEPIGEVVPLRAVEGGDDA